MPSHGCHLTAHTLSYDVFLGVDFLGQCFGNVDPLTVLFLWRVDYRNSSNTPRRVARLPINCPGSTRDHRYFCICGEVTEAADLTENLLGDEEEEDDVSNEVIAMAGLVVIVLAPMLPFTQINNKYFSYQATKTRRQDVQRHAEAAARWQQLLPKIFCIESPIRGGLVEPIMGQSQSTRV